MGNKVYVVLSDSGTLFGEAVKICSVLSCGEWAAVDSVYTHASLAFDERLEEMYSFGVNWNSDGTFSRVGLTVEDLAVEYPGTAQILALELGLSNAKYRKLRMNLSKVMKDSQSSGYNVRGLLDYVNKRIARIPKTDSILGFVGQAAMLALGGRKSLFCSQFVFGILEDSGVKLMDMDRSEVRPADFMSCSRLKNRYRGSVGSFLEKGRKLCPSKK